MRNLFLFGDSFLAPYSEKELQTFDWKRKYIAAESDNGDDQIKDLNFWLKKRIGDEDIRIINTARSGSSNDYILEQFFRFSKHFKFGDYVILLLTKYNRTRVVNRFYKPDGKMRFQDKYLDLTFPLIDDLHESIRRQTFFNPDEVEKMALETTSLQHDVKMKRYLTGIEQMCRLSKINLLTISIESELRPLTTLENIFHEIPRINEKFSYIDDRHPTWEGNKVLADRFLNHFNIKSIL